MSKVQRILDSIFEIKDVHGSKVSLSSLESKLAAKQQLLKRTKDMADKTQLNTEINQLKSLIKKASKAGK